MIDLRLWTSALLAVPLVTVIAMFSLQEVPPPLQPAVPPDAFDSTAAASLAKTLSGSAADPRPGSDADNALAELVKARFASIEGATVAEQRFDGTFNGDDVDLRNLICILPGESERQVALIVGRDVASGSGATTSIASTAAMLEAASGFSGSSHHKTLVFVSTDGDSLGALGARRFLTDYTSARLLDAAVVLSQPAQRDPSPPLVIPWSAGPESTASQLAETADETVSNETGSQAGDKGPLDDLFRLAIPAGLGDQGPLIQHGLDTVRLSSSGELPPSADEDVPSNLNPESLGRFGRAALSLMLALDPKDGPPEHGPHAYIGLAGNLLPGWTIGLLALALLMPVGAAAGVGLASAARSPGEAARGLLWTFVRALPFLAALVAIHLMALVGALGSPPFPFDPALQRLGVGGTISVAVALLAYGVFAFFLRPLAPPPPRAAATAAASALLVGALATLGILARNPYLALLVAIGLQFWLLAGSRLFGVRLVATGLVLLGLVPVLAAVMDLAGRLGTGFGVWQDLLFMFTDGQVGGLLVVLGCVLAGAGVALIAVAGPGPSAPVPEMTISARRAGAEGKPGPDLAGPAEEPVQPEPEPEPAEEPDDEAEPAPEPEGDPRLWSKPRGSSSAPSGPRRVRPSPATT